MADVFLVTKHYAIMPNSQASVEKLCLVVSSFRYSPLPQIFTSAASSSPSIYYENTTGPVNMALSDEIAARSEK